MPNLKIVLYTRWPPEATGGVERFVASLRAVLLARGHSCDVVTAADLGCARDASYAEAAQAMGNHWSHNRHLYDIAVFNKGEFAYKARVDERSSSCTALRGARPWPRGGFAAGPRRWRSCFYRGERSGRRRGNTFPWPYPDRRNGNCSGFTALRAVVSSRMRSTSHNSRGKPPIRPIATWLAAGLAHLFVCLARRGEEVSMVRSKLGAGVNAAGAPAAGDRQAAWDHGTGNVAFERVAGEYAAVVSGGRRLPDAFLL